MSKQTWEKNFSELSTSVFRHPTSSTKSVKLSYSCMPNVAVIIEGENKRKLNSHNTQRKERKCNCPRNKVCPLNGKCLSQNVICQATVTSGTNTETYVGLTASTFKARFRNHKASFNSETKRNATELCRGSPFHSLGPETEKARPP